MFRPTILGLSRATFAPASHATRAAVAIPFFQPRFYSDAAVSQPPSTPSQPTISTPPQPTPTQTQTPEAPAAPATQSSTASPPASTKKLPYLVGRAWTQRLPVYQLAKRGGNKKLTQIKKVQGDGQAMRRDLAKFLGVEEKEVRVKVPTGHLEVDGHRKEEIVKFLTESGF
ncbi:mitochondrial large subunit ribosomal protein-domain-containing protein [Sordaria brevicollis]|uniref:Large ribosomal subunit protein mL49 n=1 Tax=Sordaria brevicollis TaxID=83679 RepID=A0AAE0UEG5_SORBR|nr:mitochondrial large subunit ribosomal protein-domain-containing protein [Sordaria brevicollis]